MKAVVYEKYGAPEVLEYKKIEKNTVMDDDVLVKIHMASMDPLDWHIWSGSPLLARLMAGLRKPRISNALLNDKKDRLPRRRFSWNAENSIQKIIMKLRNIS